MFLGRFYFARRTRTHRNAPLRTALGMTSGMTLHSRSDATAVSAAELLTFRTDRLRLYKL